jgi:TonB family protein
VHEFEADEAVLREGVDARQYQLLLIRKAVGDRLFTMANNLSQRALRQRIRMMSARRSAPVASLKLLLVVPVALLAVLAFAQPAVKKVAAQVESESRQALSEAIHEVAAVRKSEPPRQEPQPKRAEPKAPAAAGQQSYDVVEQMPEFPGGPKALMTYFATHVVYPQDAEEQGLQGRVVVTFIVNEDGSVSDAKVMRSISPSLDAEALRLVDEMPKWEPGVQSGKKVRVKFTVPITFRLMGEPTEPSASSASDAQDEASSLEVSSLASLPSTAYVIDGLRIPDDLSIDDLLQVADIASISVHKDAATLREYKAEGKTGIIYIHTKRVEK